MEEQTTPVTEEVKTEEVKPVDPLNQTNETLMNLVKQQQEQLERMMKQQELTNKVNQQLSAQLNKVQVASNNPAPNNEHWIDKVLREEFEYSAKFDPVKDAANFFNKNTKQVALWWLQYQKEKGISNEEIATKYHRVVTGLETDLANQ